MNHQDRDVNRDAETAEALVWLKGLAERAARNRREAGLDATPQIKDVLAIQIGTGLVDRLTAIETNSAAFLTGIRSLQRVCAVLAASLVAVIALGGIASYRFVQLQRQERTGFAAALERERQDFIRARQDFIREVGPSLYATRVRSGIERLGGRPQDRDKAIWDYLLRSLQETQTNDAFFDVVMQFKNVIPRLQFAIDRATYRDSYRGELWIAVYLLESQVDEIASQTRRVVPPIKTLRALYSAVSPGLPANQREDLARSIDRLERAMKADRS
jgi:hypothetical protein